MSNKNQRFNLILNLNDDINFLEQMNNGSDADLLQHLREAVSEIEYLDTLINTPETEDFLTAVKVEAAHQIDRFGAEHDAGKSPTDWLWLLGYLSGKCVSAHIDFLKMAVGKAALQRKEKALHHTISSAALCLNWHRAINGDNRLRPGIAKDKQIS